MRNKGVSASQPARPVVYWSGNYPPLSCVHNEGKETGILNSQSTLLSININQGSQNPNRIITFLLASQTQGFGFYEICVVHVFPGLPLGVCTIWISLREFVNVGSWDCIQLHLQWHDQHHQGIHWNSTREILSFQYRWLRGSNLMRERYMCLLKYSNCILGWTV